MHLLPMHVPAELHRRSAPGAEDEIVARGPLVIMAHGLMSLAPAMRRGCWIKSAMGDLSPADTAETLRRWSALH